MNSMGWTPPSPFPPNSDSDRHVPTPGGGDSDINHATAGTVQPDSTTDMSSENEVNDND
eukprot:m.286111 g.286111  ORF g.286111 m.286111 type:complete len:59 (+) comp19922_c1_seq1:303-479(+)